MKIYAFLAGVLFTTNTYAEMFLDLGLGYAPRTNVYTGESCLVYYSDHKLYCSSSPLGYVSFGYTKNNWTAAYEHWSSLQDKDYGLDVISIKYRFTFNNKNK